MEEAHICIVDRDGAVSLEGKAATSPGEIARALAKGAPCARVVFETGRMAPMLYHGLAELGVPTIPTDTRRSARLSPNRWATSTLANVPPPRPTYPTTICETGARHAPSRKTH